MSPHLALLSPRWEILTILLFFCQLLYLERKRELRTQTCAFVETVVEIDPIHRWKNGNRRRRVLQVTKSSVLLSYPQSPKVTQRLGYGQGDRQAPPRTKVS